MIDNIPAIFKGYAQWIVWTLEIAGGDKPTKVPYCPQTGKHASVTDPSTWTTFETALSVFKWGGYSGVGFVLTENDPFSCIDLDDTKGNNISTNRQMEVYRNFITYTERSPSGTGAHLWVLGSVPSGRKRSSIEIYSNLRFMTMTGDVIRDEPIKDYDIELNYLWGQMSKGGIAQIVYAGLSDQKETDDDVIVKALNANNGQKFKTLLNGDWTTLYQSQSEADFAFIDILAFYTQNRKQIERIFHLYMLGQRKKAKRIDYLNWMINKSFDRMLPPVDIEGLQNKLQEAIETRVKDSEFTKKLNGKKVESLDETFVPDREIYSAPPGLVGDIARFIYDQAPRPVPEIALVGAIGLISGIVGRAYNIAGLGLNQYILLLGNTGVGKEAIASGVSKLMQSVIKTVPAAGDFIGPGEIASSGALIKYMANTAKSFVSIFGEVGLFIQELSSNNNNPVKVGLKKLILDLYNKSGEGQVLRPSIYSDREKNTLAVQSPAFTICGESTPEEFYKMLDEGMINNGLLPRFTIVEYYGKRPELSKTHMHVHPSFDLIDKLATLCGHCIMLNSQNKAIQCKMDDESQQLFDTFDRYCDDSINSAEREVKRNLWNRGHVKSLKLAAIIAVGINPYDPTITLEIAKWSIKIVKADIGNLLTRFESGQIGQEVNDESTQQVLTIKAIHKYVTSPWEAVERYKTGAKTLHDNKIIPYSYLQKQLYQKKEFKKDRRGPNDAIKKVLKTLCDTGDIQEVGRGQLQRDHGTGALCYMVAIPGTFGI